VLTDGTAYALQLSDIITYFKGEDYVLLSL